MNLKTAIKNRKDFLAPYRERFQKARKPKERARIIAKLIELEPSHLSEPWIIKEVIIWLRDRNCVDFIEDVFVKAPKKVVCTENKQRRAARDFYVMDDVDKIIQEKNVSIRKACKILVNKIYETGNDYYLTWDMNNENYDYETAIRSVYNDAKKKTGELNPPWPYYGRDIEVDENGKSTIFGGR